MRDVTPSTLVPFDSSRGPFSVDSVILCFGIAAHGISAQDVRTAIRRKELRGVRTLRGTMFERVEIERWIATRSTQTPR